MVLILILTLKMGKESRDRIRRGKGYVLVTVQGGRLDNFLGRERNYSIRIRKVEI